MTKTRQLEADYGGDVTSPAGARAHLQAVAPGQPRPELTAGLYAGIVRRMAGWGRTGGPDGRLIAALYGLRPRVAAREWLPELGGDSATPAPGSRPAAWLAWWAAVAARPTRVESPFNPPLWQAARLWSLGISPEVGRRVPIGPSIPATWRGGRERLRALLALGRRGVRHLPDLVTSDLRRLARLSGAALRCLESAGALVAEGRRLDWSRVAVGLAALALAPRAEYQAARIPARYWAALARGQTPATLALCARGLAGDRPTGREWRRCLPDPWNPPVRGRLPREVWWDSVGWAYADAWCQAAAKALAADRARSPAEYVRRNPEDGALIGWRAWTWSLAPDGRPVLRSPFRWTPWEGPVLRVEGWSTSPRVRDDLGIHAVWWEEDVHPSGVTGEVRGYGRYALGPEGWRAEEVVIVRLRLAPRTPEWIRPGLEARYGVPVEEVTCTSR